VQRFGQQAAQLSALDFGCFDPLLKPGNALQQVIDAGRGVLLAS
jgi:hypothetical protein